MQFVASGKTKKASIVSLVLANLIPLVGILWFGWTIFSVLLLYWLESVVIWLYNIPKMAMIAGSWRGLGEALKSFVTFGPFLGVELFVLLLYFGKGAPVPSGQLPSLEPLRESLGETAIALAALTASHGVSFFRNFIGKKEFLQTTLAQQKQAPLKRIMFFHIAVGIGVVPAVKLGNPLYALIFFILLKIVVDVFSHLREHGKFVLRPGEALFTARRTTPLSPKNLERVRKIFRSILFLSRYSGAPKSGPKEGQT